MIFFCEKNVKQFIKMEYVIKKQLLFISLNFSDINDFYNNAANCIIFSKI